MQNKSEKQSMGESINDFVQKNRKPIFISVGIVVLLFVGSVITLSLIDVFRKKAISEVEELSRRYESIQYNVEDTESDELQILINDLETFAKKKSGFAGGRAWAIIANIHSNKREWPQAETAWRNAAKASAKTYLGPVALFNAAVAAEEQGKITDAIELFSACASHPAAFPSAPHAQFAVGRLYETIENRAAAIDAYRTLLTKWPNNPMQNDSVWAALAQNRIIALETTENR
ncbi:MAG: tetratricopeptide repeat protein [Treponema sp.]|nr:tetratricopeptide repeat protein [Treponema sp.]